MISINSSDNTNLAKALLELMPALLLSLNQFPDTETDQLPEHTIWEDVAELRATAGQIRLLRVLSSRNACKMQELACLLGVTPSTVTSMVKRMVKQGYLERSRDDEDWRSVWVKPTERGLRALEVFDQVRLNALLKRFEQLNELERQNIGNALPALHRLLEINEEKNKEIC